MKETSLALASAVKTAAPSIVRIAAGRRGATGVVWSKDGLIVTAAHGIGDDSDEVAVTLPDYSGVTAAIVGRDPSSDLALLRAPEGEYTPLEFCASSQLDELAVGNLALALGRPGRSVRASLRIIGVLARDVATPAGGRLERYIESDRRIPRGFSGGPLVDLDGRAIGINTRGLMRGADLAIGKETVERVVSALLSHGSVPRGYLGVGAYPVRLPAKIAAELEQKRGALVIAVEEDSPAQAAGLHLGDVIVALDGESVSHPGAIRALLSDRGGKELAARILRTGALVDATIAVGESGRQRLAVFE